MHALPAPARPAHATRALRVRRAARVAASPGQTEPAAAAPPMLGGCPLGFGSGGAESIADDAAAASTSTLAATATPIPSGPDAGAAFLPTAPGTKGLPFVGETFEMFRDIPGFHARRLAKYGKVYSSHALGAPLTCVADAAQVRRLLVGEQGSAPITATDWTPAVRALLGENSLLMKTGASHAQSRRILTAAFTTAAVDSYQPLVVDATQRALAGWADACKNGASVRGLSVGKDLAFEVAARALIAGDMDPATMIAFREDFDCFTTGFFGIPVAIPGNAFWRALRARKRVLARIDKLIDAEYAAIDAEEKGAAPLRGGTPTALRLLVTATDPETGEKASREELRDQVALSLFAGHETTGTTIARMLAYITEDRHPGVLAKLRAEQDAVIAKFGPELTPSATASMPYADATVKELFRLFPIVSGVFRRAMVDLDVCGYRVPAGQRVMLMLGQTQNQVPEWVATMGGFDPDRWMALKKEPSQFMPWGQGPHICLGMGLASSEIRIILASLVRDYEWAPVDPDAGVAWRAPLQPDHGVPVQVWKRGSARPPKPPVGGDPAQPVASSPGADAWWLQPAAA